MTYSTHDFSEYLDFLGDNREFRKFGTEPAMDSDQLPEKWSNDHTSTDGMNNADIVISRVGDHHYPVIDLDVPAMLMKSTTPGHTHLYIDKAVGWTVYANLLIALVECGIVEPGYANAAIARGYSAVRLPWVRKTEDNKTLEEREN